MNIVFDLGGVVFRWDPDRIISRIFHEPGVQRRVRSAVFGHDDWIALDKGTLGHDEAVGRAVSRTGLPREDVVRLFSEVPRSLEPLPGTIELIRELRAAGNRLYVLSNMQFPSIRHLEETHDIWHLFDGTVISCRINKVKPDTEIYDYLLTTFGLEAADTVFIDDMDDNLVAASKLGIGTVAFVDASRCRDELRRLGCPGA